MAVQITQDWEERYRSDTTAWEDDETAPATKQLVLQSVLPGQSVLEIGCGRGIDSVWLAEQGYRVVACDVSRTAVRQAETRAAKHSVKVEFYVADVLHDYARLPHCEVVFERGVLHTFISGDGRALFARTIANLLDPGELWLSLAGVAATRQEAQEAATRHEPRISASQIADAVEPYFDIVSMTRTRYGFPGGQTDFPAFASVLQRRLRK